MHMSSDLSGTSNSAVAGAALVPEAGVTHIDTKTLSGAAGWQVEAAACVGKAKWLAEKILTQSARLCLFHIAGRCVV
jgi:fatty acid-binding protein DegV